MLRKDDGVILKSARSGESSKLITFLGRDAGKVSLLGKGALGPRSPFRGSLELGNFVEVVFYYKEGRTLFFLKEANVRTTLGPARDSLPHLACAMGLLELVERVCYWGSPEPAIVDLLDQYLAEPTAGDALRMFLIAEYRILELLGVVPDFATCASCGATLQDGYYYPADGTSRCAQHTQNVPHRVALDSELIEYGAAVAHSPIAIASNIPVSRAARKRFGEILHWTYTFHIEGYGLPKALKLLQEKRQR